MQASHIFYLAIILIITFLGIIIFAHFQSKRKIKEILCILNNPDFFTGEGQNGKNRNNLNELKEQLILVSSRYKDLLEKVNERNFKVDLTNSELKLHQEEIVKQNLELKAAYEALYENRKKYKQLIYNLRDEYVFFSQAPGGEMVFVSPSVKTILKYEVKEFKEDINFVYTDNPVNEKAREHKRLSLQGIQQPKYLAEIKDKDGVPHTFEISEFTVFNEKNEFISLEGVARDITRDVENESLIKEKEEKYKLLFNKASDFVFFYNVGEDSIPGKFIEVNDYTLKRLGFTREEMEKMSLNDLSHIEYWDKESEIDEFTGNKKYEQVWMTKDDNMINVEIISHNFKLNNKEIGIAIARDITERKQAEEEIHFVNEELVNQKENLEALVDNLTQAQEQLVHSEKMAALGQLIAGVAHEINTPLGAIKASIGNLNDSLGKAIKDLPSFIGNRGPEDLELFVKVLQFTGYESDNLSSREKRSLKKEVYKKLEDNGISNTDAFAELIIYLNVQDKLDELLPYLRNNNSEDVLRSVRNFASILKNSKTILLAADKAAKVVFALKKYAHRDVIEEKLPTDIVDSIETVLTLYHNQLKHGIDVVRRYDTLPVVYCYSDEINQVWTNLIHNSIQAMDQKGKLIITTKNENDYISVSIADNGCGIEPDIRDKIFEPFFTTKKQGEGSGLGLDIVKKIVEKHNGEITFTSELGVGTEFTIRIPVN